ncbi:MAG TPA: polyhydroxyalkanoic acid system family protein [Roseiarcus sp.]|nr:polyhydroxyalkanoic acid system family protein [Roseiarcus sp.]
MANDDLVLLIPHTLGAIEAKRRVAAGIATAESRYGRYLHATDLNWDANRLQFRVHALAQTVQGSVDVQDEFVELRAQLPLVIRMLAKKFLPVVKDTGQKLLK